MHKPIITMPDLATYFPFDEASGSIVYNYAEGQPNGTVTGADIVKIPNGKRSRWFNGVFATDYITVPSTGKIHTIGSGDFTTLQWVYLEGAAGGNYATINKRSNTSPNPGFLVVVLAGATVADSLYVLMDFGVTTAIVEEPKAFPRDSWQFVVLRRSGTTIDLIRNLELVDTDTTVGNDLTVANSNTLKIGARRDLALNWHGTISDTLVFESAISDEEIKAIYKATYRR